MKKSYLFIGIILIVGLFLAGCATNTQTTDKQNSEKTGEKIEENINTFDDLKKAKEAGEPVSELDKCMKEAEAGMKKYDEYTANCVNEKLEAQGYTDGIDCIQEFNDPVCEDTARYNAQVDADNECMDNMPDDIKNRITVMDCTSLMD